MLDVQCVSNRLDDRVRCIRLVRTARRDALVRGRIGIWATWCLLERGLAGDVSQQHQKTTHGRKNGCHAHGRP